MKNYIIPLLLAFCINPSIAQIVEIPDLGFKRILLETGCAAIGEGELMDVDQNNDGEIQISEAEQITKLSIRGNYTSWNYGNEINSIKGLSAFKNLRRLVIWGEENPIEQANIQGLLHLEEIYFSKAIKQLQLSQLPQLKIVHIETPHLEKLTLNETPLLESLKCSGAHIQELDLSNLAHLKTLECKDNQLKKLLIKGSDQLEEIDCSNNQLKTFDVLSLANLKNLNCSENQLQKINLSQSLNLQKLNCWKNQLTELDLLGRTQLEELNCGGNLIERLQLSPTNTLTNLDCSENQLTQLGLDGFSNLRELNCSSNLLTALHLSETPAIRYLSCASNQLTKLDLSSIAQLIKLNCHNNQLTALDLSQQSSINFLICSDNQLTSLDFSTHPVLRTLDCNNNQLQQLDVSSLKRLNELNFSDNLCTKFIFKGAERIEKLYFNNNKVSILDLSDLPKLSILECRNNQLEFLNVSTLGKLNTLDCSSNPLIKIDIRGCRLRRGFYLKNNDALVHICADKRNFFFKDRLKDYGIVGCQISEDCPDSLSVERIERAQQKTKLFQDSLAQALKIEKHQQDSLKAYWGQNCDFSKLKIIEVKGEECRRTFSTEKEYDAYEWWCQHWNQGDKFYKCVDKRNASFNGSGRYFIRVRQGDCWGSSDTMELENVLSVVSIEANSQLPLCNEPVLLTATSNTTGSLHYEWWANDSIVGTQPTYEAKEGGKYLLRVTDQYGCTTAAIHELKDPFKFNLTERHISDVFNVSAEAREICKGDSVLLTLGILSFQIDAVGYSWLNEAGQILSEEIYYVATKPGEYTLELVSQHGCRRSKSIIIYDCEDPNKIIPRTPKYATFPYTIDPKVEQGYHDAFLWRINHIDSIEAVEEKMVAPKDSQVLITDISAIDSERLFLIEMVIGTAFFVEKEVEILNLDAIPNFDFRDPERPTEAPEDFKERILKRLAMDYFIQDEETRNDYYFLASTVRMSRAEATLKKDSLAISIGSSSGFILNHGIRNNQVSATYAVTGEMDYKYFPEEQYQGLGITIPMTIEKFVLNTDQFKKGKTIFGYCSLKVDPYYVKIDPTIELHLQRNFKYYFKAEIR